MQPSCRWISHSSAETCWNPWDQFSLEFQVCTFHVKEFSRWSFPAPTQLHLSIFYTVLCLPILPVHSLESAVIMTNSQHTCFSLSCSPICRNIIPLKFSSLYASNTRSTWRLSLPHNVLSSLVQITNWQIWITTSAKFSPGKKCTTGNNFRPTFLAFFRVIFYPSHGVIL